MKTVNAQTFVNVNGSARKFWTIRFDLDNKRVTVFFGRIGTAGQKLVKLFNDRPTTREYVERKIEEKVRKGYAQVA